MAGILANMFGSSGSGMLIMGNLWWLVGIFILLFFVLLFIGYNVTFENILFFVLLFFLISIQEGLFGIPQQYIIVPIIFIVLYVSNYAYYYFNKK